MPDTVADASVPAPLAIPLEQAAEHIAKKVTSALVETRTYVGGYLTERVFGGSLVDYYRRNDTMPYLTALGALLAARGITDYRTADRLNLAVRTWEQDGALGGLLTHWPTLTATHFQRVLGLKFEDQRRLLDGARDGNWTVEKLQAEARTLRPGRAPGAGPHAKLARQMLTRIVDAIDDQEEITAALVAAGADPMRVDTFVGDLAVAIQKAQELLTDVADSAKSPSSETAPSGRVAG